MAGSTNSAGKGTRTPTGETAGVRLTRLAAFSLWLGAALFGGATAFHPPLLDPGEAQKELAIIAATPYYGALHWFIAAGALLLAAGLAGAYATCGPCRTTAAGTAGPVFLAAQLALWLNVLVDEANGMTALATRYARAVNPADRDALVAVGWAHGARNLLLGYAAACLFWAAVLVLECAGASDRNTAASSRRLAVVGAALSGLALVGLLPAAAWPRAALPVLVLTQVPAGLWLFVIGWRLWQQVPSAAGSNASPRVP